MFFLNQLPVTKAEQLTRLKGPRETTDYPGNTFIFQEVTHSKVAKSANQHRKRF